MTRTVGCVALQQSSAGSCPPPGPDPVYDRFAMDPSVAERELPVLDRDALESLFRRLHTLGQCADMRMDTRPFPGESQAEEPAGQRPPPHNWQYREELRRWVARRRGVIGDHQQQRVHHNPHLFLPSMAKRPQTLLPSLKVARKADKSFAVPSGSLESVVSSTNSSPRSFRTGMSCGTGPSWPPSPSSRELSALPTAFRRSNSERFRESAKAILRRMESFKVSSSSSAAAAASVKRAPLSGPVSISAPIDDDSRVAKRVARHLQCVDLSPTDGDENKVDACWTSTGKTTTRVFLTHNNNKKPSASAAHLLLDKRRLVRASSFTCGIVPSAADSSPSSAITPDREDEASFYENVAPVRGGRRVGINERRRQCDLLPPQVPPHSGSNWRTGITAVDFRLEENQQC
ncbi:unnamed protein product [Notodromas monacha]|uniref:Uncharacterized protein n=1 Tax=Notodromas monacha TaxID=399045 RepID=A0A7R9GJ80_9CRUS|nr:unnamed protein product [Notodromas monacha]CAG0923256.1 unnamed protein product [Notodromas monacha]